MKDDTVQKLPREVLATLEEHTGGGYVFVRIDNDNNVQVYQSFDNEMAKLAIMKKLENFIKYFDIDDDLCDMMFIDDPDDIRNEDYNEDDDEDGGFAT